ncbi:MAG: hypothetical protein KY455_11910 [Euryarchaeota archaeon]|nr:hypothetical protein [Euryarchaeota archaeon]
MRGTPSPILITILLAFALSTFPGPVSATHDDPSRVLHVDDGRFFYDSNNDCIGDTDDATGNVALRHWHFGAPFVHQEPAGGFGCLGGPQSWEVTVPDGKTGAIIGEIRYTWDQNVPGGGLNDVHLNILEADGTLLYSTSFDQFDPVVPGVDDAKEHIFTLTLPPGTYTIEEDVFFGEHTAWLLKMDVLVAEVIEL